MQTIIGLTFPGQLKDESIICRLCKDYDITLNIYEASFSTYAGWAILGIAGQDSEMKKAFDFLKSKGIKIEKIKIEK
ncbi:MAG: NIL domain-containing protein [Candidatus Omnitrophica bacterium]|nr:NIL domain-containing protein [Candidatus Omnitrophota bacterium]